MTNLPSLTVPEMIVVGLAAVLLMATPAVLGLLDAARRRRETRAAAAATAVILAQAAAALPEESPLPLPSPAPDSLPEWPAEAPTPPVLEPDVMPVAETVPPPTPVVSAPEVAEPPRPVSPVSSPKAGTIVSFGPLAPAPQGDGSGSYPFQLLELRQARLTDWPPAEVRSDPERNKIWQEGERLAARHDRTISTASLTSERAVHSTVLGKVRTDGQKFRLHFLLFSELWPESPEQAVAEAVFEVDPASSEVRGWVERI